MYAVFAQIVINRASMPYIFVDKLLKEKKCQETLIHCFPVESENDFYSQKGEGTFL